MFAFKSEQSILIDMISKFTSQTGVNDINPGSVLSTFLEAAAQEDGAQYFEMLQIIRNYHLDTTEGEDLINRALEYDIEKLGSQQGTGVVKFSDTSFVQKKSKIYSGSRGPSVGQTFIDVDPFDAPSSGTLIIGRETDNNETIAYASFTNFVSFFRFNLSGSLTNDHGTEESIILSQGGNRLITKGILVRVPASDQSPELQFITTQDATILDGDTYVDNVPIVSVLTGAKNNVPAGSIIEFDAKPFSTIQVTNEFPITNARDQETDGELRDRIKNKIQGLSKGTKAAIVNGILNLKSISDNKRVVSLRSIDSISLNDLAYTYIDDGTGLEPSFNGVGNEVLSDSSTGGEKYLQLNNFPVIKAELSTEKAQPFSIINGDTFIIEVNGVEELMTFGPEDFKINGSLTAYEVSRAINNKMSTIESRTIDGGTRVSIRAVALTNESIQVTGGTAASKLDFPVDIIETISLYKSTESEIELLSKDGKTAFIETGNQEPFAVFGGNSLTIVVDKKTENTQTVNFINTDFANPGFATAEEIVIKINKVLAGATASVIDNGVRVEIRSNTEQSTLSAIQVTGGSANSGLDFPTSEDVGYPSDYVLNRFNGQIQLTNIAESGERYEAGTTNTRAFLVSNNAETYNLADGDTLTFSIDGGGPQVATFNTADFGLITAATAQEVVNVLNTDIIGITASVTSTNRVRIQTNSWNVETGSIQITGSSGSAANIGFVQNVEVTNLKPHIAFIESVVGPYSFAEGDKLVVVVDKNPVENQFSITMDLDGTVTTGDAVGPFTTLIANINATGQNFNLKFTKNTDLVNFTLKFLTGDNAGQSKTITAYNATTGQITLNSGTISSIDAGDTFTIIPTTAANVVVFLGNDVTSSLPSVADVLLSSNGTKVQLSTKSAGLDGSIQVTGDDANDELEFSESQAEGRDGYKYYSGLIQQVQHTIDGLDSDLEVFPGIKAAGVQIEVLPPIVKLVSFEVDLDFDSTVTVLSIKDRVINEISSYVNSLGVGNDVVLAEITDRLMSIDGILDVTFITPSENIPIADNEIARVNQNDIVFA